MLLNAYGVMCKLHLQARLNKHLAACAIVSSIATTTSQAHAGIVYWNVNRVIPVTTDGLYVRVDNQTTSVSSGSTLPGWDINPYANTISAGSDLRFFASTTENRPASTYLRTQLTGGSEFPPCRSGNRLVLNLC